MANEKNPRRCPSGQTRLSGSPETATCSTCGATRKVQLYVRKGEKVSFLPYHDVPKGKKVAEVGGKQKVVKDDAAPVAKSAPKSAPKATAKPKATSAKKSAKRSTKSAAKSGSKVASLRERREAQAQAAQDAKASEQVEQPALATE